MIKSSFILAAAFFVSCLLRRQSAAERHVVWVTAIISAALLPVLTLFLPSWQPALAGRVAAAIPAVSRAVADSAAGQSADVKFRANGIESAIASRVWSLVWVAGSLFGVAILGRGIIQQRRFARRSVMLCDPVILRIAADLLRKDRTRRRIHLARSLDESMPMTWGILRPQILFPSGLDNWSYSRKRAVIAHELAHVHRFDYLFQILAQIACAIYWFNPLFWMACNRLHRESENACDDAVIKLGIDGREYASHLLEIARTVSDSGRRWSPALAMARRTTLEKRFTALLTRATNRKAATPQSIFAATALTLCLVLPLAAMRVSNTMTFPVAGFDNSPAPKVEQYTSPPLYSDEARAQAVEGIVTVEVRVGADGKVKRLEVVKGLGRGLDENALLAVRDWRFAPARRNGIPVEAVTAIDVEFSLLNAELNEEIANDMATRVGPGVIPPQVIHRIEPQYAATRQDKPVGTVVLDAVILEEGTPKIVRVIRSLDWELDEIAINALKQWRFSPAVKDGAPVKVRMNIAVNFSS